MPAVESSHKRFLAVPDSFKACVTSREARSEGAPALPKALDYFTAKIEEVERTVVDATNIVDFLVTANDENLADNYYLGTKTKKIRTAVVKCNFTDSETLLRSVEEKCRGHKVEQIIVSSHATSVQGTLDEVKEKNRHTIIIIEQLESMDVDLFNRLICLLAYNNADVSLLVCVCTARSAFISHCLNENIELLYPKFIELPSPQDQFFEVATVLARIEDEKAPCNLYLSGELLFFLKNRFLLGDFSLSELKKIVRLSILENFLKYDEYAGREETDFLERLPAYWVWFDALHDGMKKAYEERKSPDPLPGQIDLHCELQRDPKAFWAENEAVGNLKTWMCGKDREELCELMEQMAEAVQGASPEGAQKLRDRSHALLKDPVAAAAPSAPATPTTSGRGPAPHRLTMTELIAKNRVMQMENQKTGNRLREAVGEIIGLLRKHLFAWTAYADYLLMVPGGIEIPDLSQSLMTRADKPLSLGYTALAAIDQFKAVPMARWGEAVASRMDNAQFYDCVAQLERMGVIKDMSKAGKRAVMLQHRPMMNFN